MAGAAGVGSSCPSASSTTIASFPDKNCGDGKGFPYASPPAATLSSNRFAKSNATANEFRRGDGVTACSSYPCVLSDEGDPYGDVREGEGDRSTETLREGLLDGNGDPERGGGPVGRLSPATRFP
jgi:hypothetical protein